jgi:hypothetical protein
MPKTVHYDQGDSQNVIIDAYQTHGATDTAAFLAAVEAEVAPRLSTSGSYAVTDAQELTSWLGQLIAHCIENANIIRGV